MYIPAKPAPTITASKVDLAGESLLGDVITALHVLVR
jgi:hypothetical protein